MSSFEVVAILCAAAGLLMVSAGVVFVYKGIISLEAANKAEALSLEWKKQFKLNTQLPGIAFFLVGLLFISVALLFLSPRDDIEPIDFTGVVEGVDEPVTVFVQPVQEWRLAVMSDGTIAGQVLPDLSRVMIAYSAPGYTPVRQATVLESNRVDLGRVKLMRVRSKEELTKRISDVSFAPPPLAVSESSYGGPR